MEKEKKPYSTPYAEKINFNYQDQVVASGGSERCHWEGSMTHGYWGCVERIPDAGIMTN